MSIVLLIACSLLVGLAEAADHGAGVRAAAEEEGRGGWMEPSFCHSLSCPPFKTKKVTKNYEIRSYESSVWSSVVIANESSWDTATRSGFMDLFRYISGANAANKKIPMTAPVLVYVQPGRGPNCASNFTVSFYQPEGLSDPKPTNARVRLAALPAMAVAVASYGGWAGDQNIVQHAAALADALAADGVRFHNETFYTAGYDSPFRILNRHNEIWFQLLAN